MSYGSSKSEISKMESIFSDRVISNSFFNRVSTQAQKYKEKMYFPMVNTLNEYIVPFYRANNKTDHERAPIVCTFNWTQRMKRKLC